MVDLSVVIPTYRRPDTLPRALDALARQTLATDRFEAILVDDPVDDDPAAVAECARADSRPFAVRQVSRPRAGASAARNAGWRSARADVVVFIGDDILLRPEALEQHLRCHRREPDERVGVLGPVVWAGELRVTPFMRWLEKGIQFDYGSLSGDEATWTHFYTSNVSVKRAMLELVGGFDEERFPFHYEDLDIGHRMSAHGFSLIYNRDAVAEHVHEPRLEDWRARAVLQAGAERKWVTLHPEFPAYFHDRYVAAASGPRGSWLAARAIGVVPARLPILGRRVWASADRYYSRQIAPTFLEAWDAGDGG